MKKLVLCTALVLSSVAHGFAADASVEGTAQGAAPYTVQSNGNARTVEAARMSNIQVGDTVTAQDAPVTVRLSDGSAVVVEENSSVTLDKDAVTLNSGKAVFGFSPKSKLAARHQNLVVRNKSADTSAVALSAGPQSLAIEPMVSSFTVVDGQTETPLIETVSSGETLVQAGDDNWTPLVVTPRGESSRSDSSSATPAAVQAVPTKQGTVTLVTAPATSPRVVPVSRFRVPPPGISQF